MTDQEIIEQLRALQAERDEARAAERDRTRRQRELVAQLSKYVRPADLARELGITQRRAGEIMRSVRGS